MSVVTEPGAAAETGRRDELRARIVAAAADLIAHGGRDALTTRAAAAAAGVQAPTIYRLFGDKSGLLDAVAERGFAAYLARKEVREPLADPVDDLRAGWDLHVGFGLANPALYSLMYGDPRPGSPSPAAAANDAILHRHIRRLAVAGRLRVGEDLAASAVHAAGCGTVFALLALPPDRRSAQLSALTRDAVVTAITVDAPAGADPTPTTAAVALRAALPESTALTSGERALLDEWLRRIVGDLPR